MKRLLLYLLILTTAFAAAVACGNLFFGHSLGPFFILEVTLLACLSLSLLVTLLLDADTRRETIIRIWLFIVSFFVAYASTDYIAGYFLIPRHSPRSAASRYRHHHLVPNTLSAVRSAEFSYIQRVNNFGLRGSDIHPKKASGQYRILMLGDSFTMGKGVEDSQTFSVLLQKSLNAKKSRPEKIQVLNAGVDSYSPILSFLYLTRDLGSLEPDLVVLNLDMSDLEQETAYRKAANYQASGEILGVEGPEEQDEALLLTAKARRWINRNLFATRLLLFYLKEALSSNNEITTENIVTLAHPELLKHTLAGDTSERKEQWQNLFDSLLKIKTHCEENGIKFLLTVYPWGHQVGSSEWTPGRQAFIPGSARPSDKTLESILSFAIRNEIDLLNLFPAFRSYQGPHPLYYNLDMHWTPTGHRLMAEQLERYIEAAYF